MKPNTNHSLFDDLRYLGFGDLENISIYNDKNKKTPLSTEEKKIKPDLFNHKLKCPVCESHITVRSVRASSIRTLSRDTDFMVYYADPNPMFYGAWVCTNCGYAALSSHFNNILYKQEKLIKEKIGLKWKPKEYPLEYDVDISIERHKLALLNAIIKNAVLSERAFICLKIAWHYRLKKDPVNEKSFLDQALQGFLKAFETEAFPIGKMDEATLSYLIGELYRRLGDSQKALIWFARVLAHRNAKDKIKDMARDQKYLIMNEKKQKTAPPVEENALKNDNDTDKKNFLARLFR